MGSFSPFSPPWLENKSFGGVTDELVPPGFWNMPRRWRRAGKFIVPVERFARVEPCSLAERSADIELTGVAAMGG